MKLRACIIFVATASLLLAAASATAAKSDSDRDGLSNRDERALGTNPNSYTAYSKYARRVIRYTERTGALVVYVKKGRRLTARVNKDTQVYCDDESYFVDDGDKSEDDEDLEQSFGMSGGPDDEDELDDEDEFDDEEDDYFDTAPCTTEVLRRGLKLEIVKYSSSRGRNYYDELEVA